MSSDVDLRADQTSDAPDTLTLPAEWEVQRVTTQVETKRVWIPLSETTAMVLAAAITHAGLDVEAWILDRALVAAPAPTGSADR